MDNIVRMIFEKVSSGKIDKETGMDMLKSIKLQSKKAYKDIAVIGVSIKMPGAGDLEQYWDNIRKGLEFIREFPQKRQLDCKGFILNFTSLAEKDIKYSQGGYLDEVDGFDYSFFNLSPKEASLMDPNQRLFLEASWEAIEDAGYGGSRLAGSRTGVYLGYADWPLYGQYISKKEPSSFSIATAGNTPSLIASRISYLLDLKGPALMVDTACSSSLTAVHLACMALKNGECDQAITGGVKLSLMPVEGFNIGIEASNRKTSTFDDSSDGTVWGEGTVALLLKPLEKAMYDNDNIYAVIKGSAINQDGTSVGITAPNASAQEKVLVKAWEEAGINPETITYIEAHGTGTKLGDPIEIDGIQRAFKRFTQKKQFCAISSVKTNIGHLDSTSGIAGLAKAIAALKYKELLPAINFSRPNRQIAFENSPVYVNDKLQKWETESIPRRCGVSSFGFSGTNCHVVLEEAPEICTQRPDESEGYKVLALSAKSRLALKDSVEMYREYIRENEAGLSDICYTANTGRGHYNYRLAILALNREDLLEKLNILSSERLDTDTCDEVFFGEHRVVTVQREKKQGELAADEKRHLSGEARDLLAEIIQEDNKSKEKLNALCGLYIKGSDIDWKLLYSGEKRRKTRVPTYPFQRTRCWVDIDESSVKERQADVEEFSTAFDKKTEMPNDVILKGKKDNDYTLLEKTLGNVWGRILGLKEIDVFDDFFELGGNSMMAIKMEVDLEVQNIKFSSDEVYKYVCIKELAQHLEAGEVKGEIKILDNIEPFNEVFYKNCFYNSLFPIVNHFEESIIPFILNDIIVFEQSGASGENGYSVQYCAANPIEHIFGQAGFSVDTRFENKDIVNELIECISDEKPVVVWVDSYYEPIRKDTYLIRHLDHSLLVYGYDKQEELFYIIEHDRQENLSYKKCTLPYSDLMNACHGFAENFANDGRTTTHCIFKHNKNSHSQHELKEYMRAFAQNILGNRAKIEDSMMALDNFIDSFKRISSSEEALKNNIQYLVGFINDVINAKYVEKYRLSKLFEEKSEVMELLNSIIGKWDLVRKGMARFMYLPVYKPEVFVSSYEKLVDIAVHEKRFNEVLLSKLKIIK